MIRVGEATAVAQTGPALTVTLTLTHCARGTQNHSGRPTSPGLPRGGAVAALSVGTRRSPIAIFSRSNGLIAGAPVWGVSDGRSSAILGKLMQQHSRSSFMRSSRL